MDGYQLARTLAAGVPLEAVQAFATVRFLEQNFNLTPKDADEDAGPASYVSLLGYALLTTWK